MFSALAALAASPQSPIPRAAQLGGPARRVLLGSRHDPRDLRGIAVDGRAVPSAHARRRRDRQDRVHRKGGRRRGHRELAATRLDPRLRRREGTARGAPEGQREERPKAQHEERPKDIDSGYVPSKEAVILWTTFAASDYASDRSCVNGISTGPTDTPMMPDFEKAPSAALVDQFATCLGRRSIPEEQAYPMLFLNSAAASYISGENLNTDGGTSGGLTPGRLERRPRSRGRRRTSRRPARLGAIARERVASPVRLRRSRFAGPHHLLSEKPAQSGGIAQQAAQRCARRLRRRDVIPVGDGEHLVEDREALA